MLTFAGDESGDPSFNFRRGASSHFVFAMIATAEPDVLRACLDQVRRERGLPAYFEFSYHELTSTRLRKSVFEALNQEQFSAWVIVVDKQVLPDYFRSRGGRQFYAFFVGELNCTFTNCDKQKPARLAKPSGLGRPPQSATLSPGVKNLTVF